MINGFKKEMMFFTRGGRLAAVILVMFSLAVLSPIMFGMMQSMIEVLTQVSPSEDYAEMMKVFTNFSASDITMYNIQYVAGIGAIVVLFVFKGAAGTEQKQRSVVIPQCSGLSAVNYALPKFIIYPMFTFVISVLSVYAGSGAALLFFNGTLDWGYVSAAAFCTGVFLAFSTAVQFCVGLCTGRSGLAIIICIAMQTFLPTLLSTFRIDRFNPFALYSIAIASAMASGESGNTLMSAVEAASTSGDITPLNFAVSIGTALIISVLLYFVTIFVLHTKEVHNEGNEPVL